MCARTQLKHLYRVKRIVPTINDLFSRFCQQGLIKQRSREQYCFWHPLRKVDISEGVRRKNIRPYRHTRPPRRDERRTVKNIAWLFTDNILYCTRQPSVDWWLLLQDDRLLSILISGSPWCVGRVCNNIFHVQTPILLVLCIILSSSRMRAVVRHDRVLTGPRAQSDLVHIYIYVCIHILYSYKRASAVFARNVSFRRGCKPLINSVWLNIYVWEFFVWSLARAS